MDNFLSVAKPVFSFIAIFFAHISHLGTEIESFKSKIKKRKKQKYLYSEEKIQFSKGHRFLEDPSTTITK